MLMMRHTYVHEFPSILGMRRLSIVLLQDIYLRMPSSVPDACFSVAARRISMVKERTSTQRRYVSPEKVSLNCHPEQWPRYNNSKLTVRLKIVLTQDSTWGLLQTRIRDTAILPINSYPCPVPSPLAWQNAEIGQEEIRRTLME